MPRSAATMLGLILVAVSIGFNTAHYPAVWEMIGPAQVCESEQVAALLSPEQPDDPPPAPPLEEDSLKAKPIEMEPMEKIARKAAETESQRPLVPVAVVSSFGAAANAAFGGAGIRRLPPVGKADFDAAGCNLAQLPGGSIPVYPTTGIE